MQNDCAIGIDVGGTKIAGGIVDASGKVLERRIIPTLAGRGGQAVLADTLQLAQGLIHFAQDQGYSMRGIGLAICELVDPQGRITSDYTIQWTTLPIQARLNELAPTVIEADVRAHALAEARLGAGQQFKDFIYLSVGTGISSTLVQAGKPYAGTHGNALVLSSMPVTVFDKRFDERELKVSFTLEPFASGAGLVQRYNRLHSVPIYRVEEIVAQANDGDESAREILQTGGEALGSAAGWLANVLDPEAIIVGGGLGLADGIYWESFIESTRRHIYAETTRTLPILHARCGVDAGVIGAALLGLLHSYSVSSQ